MNTTTEVIVTEQTVAELFTRNWWILALRGLVAVLFGVIAFVTPGITLLALIWLFGGYALANGILAIVLAFKAPKGAPKFGSLILPGVLSIIAGVIAFAMPGITALSLVILIAAWAAVIGVFEIVAAIQLRKVIEHEWLLILAGLASLFFGFALLVRPGAGALVLVWWIGAYAIVFGILLMVLAFRMRNWKAFGEADDGVTVRSS